MVVLYLRVLSEWLAMLITSCIVWLPIAGMLFYLLRMWIRQRSMKQYAELWQPLSNGMRPVVIGFFHPYCNAGGGGERVLWTAIRALQNRYKHVCCVVYTGDIDATSDQILGLARQRFNILLPRIGEKDLRFVYLYSRRWVEAGQYPMLTLLGQSLGSVVLGMEALWQCVPDVFVDTMGYAFTLPVFRYLGSCRTACYVHYPTISTDMIQQVAQHKPSYNNPTFIHTSYILSSLKLIYYRLFAWVYKMAGNRANVVMVNSSWTYGHICSLWNRTYRMSIVYPPCDVTQFTMLPLVDRTCSIRHTIVSVGQFRPEKDHTLQIQAFHAFLQHQARSEAQSNYSLVLVGGCRNLDDHHRIERLKDLVADLGLEGCVHFKINVSFDELKALLAEAAVGLHTMWNEHFGIGVVELMAAGLIILAHDSGGPKLDIVVPYEGKPSGFLAHDGESYAGALHAIFNLSSGDQMSMKTIARKSALRFSEDSFEAGFLQAIQSLL